jgi:hypothetical protein
MENYGKNWEITTRKTAKEILECKTIEDAKIVNEILNNIKITDRINDMLLKDTNISPEFHSALRQERENRKPRNLCESTIHLCLNFQLMDMNLKKLRGL